MDEERKAVSKQRIVKYTGNDRLINDDKSFLGKATNSRQDHLKAVTSKVRR